jgi:uncharacterized protein YndB with AHSA1/START domain
VLKQNLNMNSESEPVIVQEKFNIYLDKLWNAITRPEEMKQWFFENIPTFKAEVGFETSFRVHSEGRHFNHVWKILEVVPYKKIKYHWSYSEYAGVGYVTFELYERNGQTILCVINEGLETFPKDIPEFTRESCQGGWDYFIKNRLKSYIDTIK